VFDSYRYFLRFLDPDLSYGRSQAGVFATSLLRLADAPVLPWSFADAARWYRAWVDELVELARNRRAPVDLGPLAGRIQQLSAAADRYEESFARVMALGSQSLRPHSERLARLNLGIAQSERTLLFEEGLPGRPWVKYPISGPSSYTGQVARTRPVLREALELDRIELARDQVARTAAALGRLSDRVSELTDLLDSIH
jgi:N-acetylated-alpha-linked acidic dipeptidase